MKPTDTDWTPTLISRLRILFEDGLSYSHIASELAMTRGAVLGKCNRLGLRRRKPKPKPTAFRVSKRPRWDPLKNSQAQKIQAGPRINPVFENPNPSWVEYDAAIPKRRRRNIRNLGPRDCRYIVGDPATPEHFYCGACKMPALPYCADHARRCYHPAGGA